MARMIGPLQASESRETGVVHKIDISEALQLLRKLPENISRGPAVAWIRRLKGNHKGLISEGNTEGVRDDLAVQIDDPTSQSHKFSLKESSSVIGAAILEQFPCHRVVSSAHPVGLPSVEEPLGL